MDDGASAGGPVSGGSQGGPGPVDLEMAGHEDDEDEDGEEDVDDYRYG